MKNFLIIVSAVAISSCLKIQKKIEDTDPPPPSVAQPVLSRENQTKAEPIIVNLNEPVSLNGDWEVIADEIRMGAQSAIYNEHYNLRLVAKKIIIESGAVIQTFPHWRFKAPIDTAAADGGTVQIYAEEIIGNLQVYMNGQEGGNGKAGWSGVTDASFQKSECFSNSGRDAGRSGSFFLETKKANQFYITTNMSIAKAGEPEAQVIDPLGRHIEIFRNKDHYKYPVRENCSVSPQPAQAGRPGQICLKMQENENPVCR